jgi:tetrahydromethanopterin S-methyltransferase subunit D
VINVGDKVYYTTPSGGTPAINANATGKEFGVALKAITAGATETIPVALKGGI